MTTGPTRSEVLDESSTLSCPDWARFEHAGLLPAGSTRLLNQLDRADLKSVLRPEIISLLPVVFGAIASDMHPAKYLLTVLSDNCRADSSLWDILAKGSAGVDLFTPFTLLLGRPNIDTATSDKAVAVFSSIACHGNGNSITVDQAKLFASHLVSGRFRTSSVGALEGLGNLLKVDKFREPVMTVPGVVDKIFSAGATPAGLYRALLALWVGSFNDEVLTTVLSAEPHKISKFLKLIFEESRVEKVVRMALAVVRNVIASPAIAECIVEDGVAHAIQPLEYEKWRDADLYDEIRSVTNLIATETSKHSNFERYEKELMSGVLRWGYIHSEKFWLENVKNFEKENFHAIQVLISLLASSNPVTQAVACHDLGEFARLHPSGKRVITKMNGKDAVMGLMTNGTREVAKEALLCTQKLMLNQWQKTQAPKTAGK